ncbi:MAG: alpha-amylase/4-alpha-glucanotransferase domain-containing protein [Promethearchaeota archaeon]
MNDEKSLYLGITFHFHQPVDNYDSVIEDCYQKAYLPLINYMVKYPQLKFTLHFSGNILQWFLDNKPEIIEKIKLMARRSQIEIIGGGFYEPIYAIIPDRDKIAQIKKLSELIENVFHLDVNGAWLSERVWEPNYPAFLRAAGLKYVIVDDNHLRSCGMVEEDTFYTYNTEDQGKTIRIFPINEKIRYLIPWKPTPYTINYLRDLTNEKGDRMVLMISDAEKMGVWGTTHKICYIQGKGHHEGDEGKPFIPTLLSKFIRNSWIKPITLTEYMKIQPPKGLIYLPTASYDKMEEWALPTLMRKKFENIKEKLENDENNKDYLQFLKGGFWRYFMVKYPESNNMHKKMLHVREKILQMERELKKINDLEKVKNIRMKLSQAWEEIYKAQCNDAYWHGLFGGVYLQFLRFAIYTHLINAERIIDEITQQFYSFPKSYISILPADFNKDGKTAILIESDIINVYFNLDDGGTIFELDYKPKSYNLLNTLTRWFEAYHEEEKIQKKEILIDHYRQSMLRIRFFENTTTIHDLESNTYVELGDFIDGAFKLIKSQKENKMATIELEKNGTINFLKSSIKIPCVLTKKILIEENQILISIHGILKNLFEKEKELTDAIKHINLGIDLPFFFNGDPTKFSWECSNLKVLPRLDEFKELLEMCEFQGSDFTAKDESYNLKFSIMITSNTENVKIGKYPIITRTYTEEGYKDLYQGVSVIPIFNISKEFEIILELTII